MTLIGAEARSGVAAPDDVDRRAAGRAVPLDLGNVAEIGDHRAAHRANVPTRLAVRECLETTRLHEISLILSPDAATSIARAWGHVKE